MKQPSHRPAKIGNAGTSSMLVAIVTAALLTATLFTSTAQADPIITVVASSAPNFNGSPSFAGYNTNAINSLQNSLGDIGDRFTDPTAYEAFDEGEFVSIFDLIVSNFSSWRGIANSPAPFDLERGNRLHFGAHILGDGINQFALEDVMAEITSDNSNSLGFTANFTNYNQFRVGIDWVDGIRGNGNDVLITSGSASQMVDEFMHVGVGNAFNATGEPGLTNQDKINNAAIQPRFPIMVTGTYTLTDANGTFNGSTHIFVIPEPSSLGVIALCGLAGMVRRRRS